MRSESGLSWEQVYWAIRSFLPLCTCPQMIAKAPGILILVLLVSFSEELDSQIRNPQIMKADCIVLNLMRERYALGTVKVQGKDVVQSWQRHEL